MCEGNAEGHKPNSILGYAMASALPQCNRQLTVPQSCSVKGSVKGLVKGSVKGSVKGIGQRIGARDRAKDRSRDWSRDLNLNDDLMPIIMASHEDALSHW